MDKSSLNIGRHQLEMLYKKHYNLLLNYGFKYCPDEDLVRDSIQDLFVELYQRRTHLKEYTIGYLLVALKNTIIDNCSKKSPSTSFTEIFLEDIKIYDDDLEKLFEKNDEDIQLSKRVLKIFSELPERQRTIIYLRYIKGLKYNEITEIMEMNTQSAMNLISRALQSFRKHFVHFLIFFS